MNDQTKQALSALVDEELTAEERAVMLEQLLRSDELSRRWGRYHLIGDVLRGEAVHPEYRQVAQGVKQRLTEEATILAPVVEGPKRKWGTRDWVKPVMGAAIAASVALFAVFKIPSTEFGGELLFGDGQSVRLQTMPTSQVSYSPNSGTRWSIAKPEVESKLNRYLLTHQGYAPITHMKGLPTAAFVRYDAGR